MLDILAFSNAMRHGTVSFLRPLGLRPFEDVGGEIVAFRDDDAVVFPMTAVAEHPEKTLRLPLDDASSRMWPVHYADLTTAGGAIEAHLPAEITILDVDDVPGIEVALLYDWVPGETLARRVTRARARQERDQLDDLLWPLADIAEALRLSGMAHGDIAPGNIIVRPDGGMTLIDLDRMGYRDAVDTIAPRRRPGYRIPRGGGDPVEEDAFALLVLMTSCAVLADASVPAERDRAPEASHPTLLFSTWDLMDPRRSRLVREIEGDLTPVSSGMLDLLVEACTGPSDRIPALLRDAVRLTRRLVSQPDTTGADGAAAGWHPVGGFEPEAPVPAAEPEQMPEPARVFDPRRAVQTWPDLDVSPEDSDGSVSEGAGDAPVAAAWAPDSLDWRSRGELVNMLRELGDRGVGLARTNRRGHRAERRRQEVAAELQEALAHNDRGTLVRLAMTGSLAELGESSRSDLVQVVRALSHDQISRAVASDDDGMITSAIDETLFERDSDLDPEFRERVRLARSRVRWTDQVVEAVRAGDADAGAALMEEPPAGAVDRLPETVRNRARQLVERHDAVRNARAFIEDRDAEGLVRSLGRLVTVSAVWSDHIDPEVVEEFLGIEQIEYHLVQRLVEGSVPVADQWMVDMVLAAGRMPDATRQAGLTPSEAEKRISGTR